MENKTDLQRLRSLTKALEKGLEESQLLSQSLEESGHYLESQFASLSYDLQDMLSLLDSLKVSLWQESNKAKRGIK